MNNTLRIAGLHKTYPNGTKALQNIDLTLQNGMFGLLGPNGAGKSSLMKTIAGLQKPDGGGIYFNDIDIVQHPGFVKKQLGFLPQDFGVYPKVSAFDLLMHLAALKGVGAERKEQALALLHQVNLYEHRHKEVYTFSGGMKQRFGIAQALLGNPQLIIVDEPTAGLDLEERNRFNALLSEIGEHVIVILSTHLVEDVKHLCERMGIIHQGKLLALGNPIELLASMQGKIWHKAIQPQEKAHYEAHYRLISAQFNRRQLHIHVHAEVQPDSSFSLIAPSLEDVYFASLHAH